MNILVIGNGFDLAHGMKTKYEHFLVYARICLQHHDIFLGENEVNEIWAEETDEFKKKCILSLGNLFDEHKEIAKEFYDSINENCWMNYFISIYQNRVTQRKDGWIDFEKEILEAIKTLDDARKEVSRLIELNGSEYEPMTKAYNNRLSPLLGITSDNKFSMVYFQNIKEKLVTDLKHLTRALEIYICFFASTTGEQEPIGMIKNLDIDKVLSFNYTNTYEKIYGGNVEYDFIHGKAELNSNDNCNLVIGINEYLDGDEKNFDNYFIEFKKFFQRIYKRTGSKYSIWLKNYDEVRKRFAKTNPPELNVYFYGHSLDVTDKDILYRLIMAEGAKVTIFYHSQQALNSEIANLVSVIDEETLIRKTDASNSEIQFIQVE